MSHLVFAMDAPTRTLQKTTTGEFRSYRFDVGLRLGVFATSWNGGVGIQPLIQRWLKPYLGVMTAACMDTAYGKISAPGLLTSGSFTTGGPITVMVLDRKGS